MSEPYAEALDIARGLLATTYPLAQWHHREHCLATACLLIEWPDTDWSVKLPHFIRRYNLATGGENTDTRGYHETITQFFLGAIRRFLGTLPPGTRDEVIEALLASPLLQQDYVLRFYSRERLFSREARLGYLPPDLAAPR